MGSSWVRGLWFSGAALSACLVPRTASAEPPSALKFSATIYSTNAAVALRADRSCQGERCRERYLSLVPIAGGAAQLSLGGFGFHEHHHGKLCVPLTMAAVGGQTLGLAAYVGGVELALKGPNGSRIELSVVPYNDGGSAAGLGLAWIN